MKSKEEWQASSGLTDEASWEAYQEAATYQEEREKELGERKAELNEELREEQDTQRKAELRQRAIELDKDEIEIVAREAGIADPDALVNYCQKADGSYDLAKAKGIADAVHTADLQQGLDLDSGRTKLGRRLGDVETAEWLEQASGSEFKKFLANAEKKERAKQEKVEFFEV